MTIFDRYVVKFFIRVALVCFISGAGLYCTIDAFNNLDELMGLGRQVGDLPAVIADYYGPRVIWCFDRGSALLALIAAMFVVTWLQRTEEFTAVMAAGIPKSRIIRPLIAAAIVIAGVAAINRELVLPKIRDQLVRNARDWHGQTAQPVYPTTDNRTNILLNGKSVIIGQRKIEQPNFQLYEQFGEFGRYLQGSAAYSRPAGPGRPRGYLLDGVTSPSNPASLPSAVHHGTPILLTPRDHDWLEADQLFVVSDVRFEQLAGGSAWRRYASTWELVSDLRNPSVDYGLDERVTVHARVVQPGLDVTLFFLGLPLVITRQSRNIFVAAGWCLLVVIGFFFVVITCQILGSNGYMLSPALAAWFPLFVFVPVAAAVSQPMWEK